MDTHSATIIPRLIDRHEKELIEEWIAAQLQAGNRTAALMKEGELRVQCTDFLRQFSQAALSDPTLNINGPAWKSTRDLLTEASRSRALLGFTPSETATFVFSLKKPLFSRIGSELQTQPEELLRENWNATALLDSLGLFTT